KTLGVHGFSLGKKLQRSAVKLEILHGRNIMELIFHLIFSCTGSQLSETGHSLEFLNYFSTDYNDEIRQEQLRELSYLNGSEDSGRGRGVRGRGIRIAPTAPSRGRGGAIPPPPPPGRGILTPRGTTVTRGALPAPPLARGVPTPRARGSPTMPGYRAPPLPAHKGYEEYFLGKLLTKYETWNNVYHLYVYGYGHYDVFKQGDWQHPHGQNKAQRGEKRSILSLWK
ncbi:hypothetical protein FD755_022177, partial [Muntiacus reevesi]